MPNITDIIIENEGLIYKIINKYKNYFELEDLYQVAVIGIIKAYKNYKPGYNATFTSYAYPYILGEVIKYINEYRNIKVNKEMRILYKQIEKATEILSQKLMKLPTTYELSAFLEIDEQLLNEVITANLTVKSLDMIISEDDNNLRLYDKFGYCDSAIENYSLISELEKLPPEERKIIEFRFYNNMSQTETGNSLGITQMEVSRKERKILQKLHDNIAA